ncbi:hypothetical protein BZG36_04770 [Bifiguratus adelaidae]|uniref:Enoyl reductase (ER) domain-containing protein n=1 Tax=Bifiguratus adelaidae TaxID=1938954 RepID=A0A261XVN4_9FUNG|nr:hypothetical protein BZG36_04770 [Bifiguratus adelaidae]
MDIVNGYACFGKGEKLRETELPLKTFTEDDVDIDVTHCGICGTDVHTMDSGWGPTKYPCLVGHEITGNVTRTGENVKHVQPGDRVGVGAQSGACGSCEYCKSGRANLCPKFIWTYNDTWPEGTPTYGGYGNRWRGDQRFVFKLPDGLENDEAASLLCAGVTTYTPLKRHHVGPGSKVGVVGIGGLGHLAIQWSKAMGAKVVAISSGERKKQDALQLGADEFLVWKDQEAVRKYENYFTHIVCTAIGDSEQLWDAYFHVLAPEGIFILLGLPDKRLSGLSATLIAFKELIITGSVIGSPDMIREMLDFAQKHNVHPWIEKIPMDKVNDAIEGMRQGKVRYRYVLEQ